VLRRATGFMRLVGIPLSHVCLVRSSTDNEDIGCSIGYSACFEPTASQSLTYSRLVVKVAPVAVSTPAIPNGGLIVFG
jgi:hypothetical protein